MGDQAKTNIKQKGKYLTVNNKHLLITQQKYMSLSLVTSNPNKGEINHSWVRGATKMIEKR